MPVNGSDVKLVAATRAKYNTVSPKDDNTLYFVTEVDGSRVLYLGNILIAGGLIDAKQNKLVSGSTIKTVDGATLLGAGNIVTAPVSPENYNLLKKVSNGLMVDTADINSAATLAASDVIPVLVYDYIGAPNYFAGLDSNGKVPLSQMPSMPSGGVNYWTSDNETDPGGSYMILPSAYRNFKVLIVAVYDATVSFRSTFVIYGSDTNFSNFTFGMIHPSNYEPFANPMGGFSYNKTTGRIDLSELNWGASQNPILYGVGVIY